MKFISVREAKSTLSETIAESQEQRESSSRNTASQSAC